MAEKLLLKRRLYEMLNTINKEMVQLEKKYMICQKDEESYYCTKLECLSQHKKDIEELIMICVDRNKF